MFWDILQNPTFPEKEVELEKATQIAATGGGRTDLQYKNVMREKLSTTVRSSRKRTPNRSKVTPDCWFQKNTSWQEHRLAVFGDVKAEQVLKLINSGTIRLASWHYPTPKPVAPALVVPSKSVKATSFVIGYRIGHPEPDRASRSSE
jgi:predicted Zn-dependent peptidase